MAVSQDPQMCHTMYLHTGYKASLIIYDIESCFDSQNKFSRRKIRRRIVMYRGALPLLNKTTLDLTLYTCLCTHIKLHIGLYEINTCRISTTIQTLVH